MTYDIVARLRVLASEFPTIERWMDNEWTNAADEIERLRAVLRSIAAMEHQEPACAAYAKDALNGLPVPTEPSGGECAPLREQLVAADEIERLRAELKAWQDAHRAHPDEFGGNPE
jgi:hypothetical protein